MKKYVTVDNFVFVAFVSAFLASPAFAQEGTALGGFDNVQTILQSVLSWVGGISVALVTLALLFVGYRMIFQAAHWRDVAPVFWGGVICGAAGGIAKTIGSFTTT